MIIVRNETISAGVCRSKWCGQTLDLSDVSKKLELANVLASIRDGQYLCWIRKAMAVM